MYQVFFVSRNVEKLHDILDVVGSLTDIRVDHFDYSINELQTSNLEMLIQEKALSAFARVRHPVIVDHTCLGLAALKGLPGTSASEFWRCVGTDVCNVVTKLGNDQADVTVALGFTDGQKLLHVKQKQKGSVAASPKGARNFDWDRVFIPKGDGRTYAEMSPHEKNRLSPRAKAFAKLIRQIRRFG